jgi:hypothetical protein
LTPIHHFFRVSTILAIFELKYSFPGEIIFSWEYQTDFPYAKPGYFQMRKRFNFFGKPVCPGDYKSQWHGVFKSKNPCDFQIRSAWQFSYFDILAIFKPE